MAVGQGGPVRLVRLWDFTAGQELRPLAGHAGLVTDVAFAPDGKTLVSSAPIERSAVYRSSERP